MGVELPTPKTWSACSAAVLENAGNVRGQDCGPSNRVGSRPNTRSGVPLAKGPGRAGSVTVPLEDPADHLAMGVSHDISKSGCAAGRFTVGLVVVSGSLLRNGTDVRNLWNQTK